MDYGGKRGKKRKKKRKKKVGTWQVISEIYWYEKNNKNKWHIYSSIGGIQLVCTLSLLIRIIMKQIWKHYWSTGVDNIFFPILH